MVCSLLLYLFCLVYFDLTLFHKYLVCCCQRNMKFHNCLFSPFGLYSFSPSLLTCGIRARSSRYQFNKSVKYWGRWSYMCCLMDQQSTRYAQPKRIPWWKGTSLWRQWLHLLEEAYAISFLSNILQDVEHFYQQVSYTSNGLHWMDWRWGMLGKSKCSSDEPFIWSMITKWMQ